MPESTNTIDMFVFCYTKYNSPIQIFLAIKIHFTGKTTERQEQWNGNSSPAYILPSRTL